jgi:methionyl aminopeptidase
MFRYSLHASRPLEDGDIVNVDITVYLDGFHGDTSQTFLVGAVVRTTPQSLGVTSDRPVIQDQSGIDLVHTTNLALEASIEACGPYRPFSNIGCTIHKIATQRGYSVNSQFTGHGIGSVFHRPPWIFHHSTFSKMLESLD